MCFLQFLRRVFRQRVWEYHLYLSLSFGGFKNTGRIEYRKYVGDDIADTLAISESFALGFAEHTHERKSQSYCTGQVAELVLQYTCNYRRHSTDFIYGFANFRDVQILTRRCGISAEFFYRSIRIIGAPHSAWRYRTILKTLDTLAQVHLERLEGNPVGSVRQPRIEFILQRH